jgi:hypothetical protein
MVGKTFQAEKTAYAKTAVTNDMEVGGQKIGA